MNNNLPFPMLSRVRNISEAIELALDGVQKGRWQLFRGQPNAEWQVTSSAERLTEERRAEVLDQFTRFYHWAKTSPLMQMYTESRDALWVIAQHYGIPTNFIDFTDDPRIAAFFACDLNRQPEPGQNACIICLNVTEFQSFTDSGFFGKGPNSPELVRIDVANLWRLQAQKGSFLWNPIKNIERIFNFDRIIFPYTNHSPQIPPREAIYPVQQSQLELQLASFFMNEHMIEGEKQIKSLGIKTFDFTSENDDNALAYEEILIPSDWDCDHLWSCHSIEKAETTLPGVTLHINNATVQNIAECIDKLLTIEFIALNRGCGININVSASSVDHKFLKYMTNAIRRIWNGMRILPYTDSEIRTAINIAVNLIYLKMEGRQLNDLRGTSNHYIEMAASIDGGGYSRASASTQSLQEAMNPDFLALLRKSKSSSESGSSLLGLNIQISPHRRFTFNGLRKLMVNELIPTQVVWRGSGSEDAMLRTVIYYSPTEFNIFGLA